MLLGRKKKTRLEFLGAAGTVTGSRTLLHYHGKRYLIDCGLFQGPKEIRNQNWDHFYQADKIDAVILTHAHVDHSAYLPKLVREGFKGPIYCSHGTHELCKIILVDSAHLQEEDAKYANQTKYSSHHPALPLYTVEDAEKALKLFRPLKQNDWFELSPGIGLQLQRSGHILGSSFVKIGYSTDHTSQLLVFSGDLGHNRSYVIRGPEQISEADYLVMESTYGNRVHEKADPLETLAKIINQTYERKGVLVIPAFSVGRTQEMLYLINRLEREHKVPVIPVYLDSPMALDATEIYQRCSKELKIEEQDGKLQNVLCSTHFRPVRTVQESRELTTKMGPLIIISAAGMITGGRILHHLKARLPDERNTVLFTGHQVEGTKGKLLLNHMGSIYIHHEEVFVRAQIRSMQGLSAHADSNEIIQWMRGLKRPPKKVFLNHGEKIPLETLAYRIKRELGLDVVIPRQGAQFELG